MLCVYLGCPLSLCLSNYGNLNHIKFHPCGYISMSPVAFGSFAEHSQQVSLNNDVAGPLTHLSVCLASIPKHSLMSHWPPLNQRQVTWSERVTGRAVAFLHQRPLAHVRAWVSFLYESQCVSIWSICLDWQSQWHVLRLDHQTHNFNTTFQYFLNVSFLTSCFTLLSWYIIIRCSTFSLKGDIDITKCDYNAGYVHLNPSVAHIQTVEHMQAFIMCLFKGCSGPCTCGRKCMCDDKPVWFPSCLISAALCWANAFREYLLSSAT